MTNCEKHGCPLTPLFTSSYCKLCDEEAAVNSPVSRADAYFQDAGWYHNYPVCGTDANGSDVDDMDVCMGMVVGGRHLHKVGLRQEALDALRNAQDTPQPDVCMGLSVKLEAIRLWQQRGLIDEHCARDLARSALQGHSLSAYERDMAEAMAASLA